jgi:hypothetical protein
VSKEFGAVNDYTIRFTPTNAIPRLAWVVIEYPINVTIPDPGAFIASCSAQTSGTYLGSDGYCVLD